MEITASLSRAKERLTFRTGCLILCTIKLCHQSKTLHTYFLSPTSAWKWSSNDAYKAWACLTSTNSFPRYGVKYKSQRWSLSTGLDSSVGGKYFKKIGVTVHEQQMSISALPKLFFSGLLQTLSEVKLHYYISLDNYILWQDCNKVRVPYHSIEQTTWLSLCDMK